MKLFYSIGSLVVIALITTPALADSNASGGGLINSESVDLTAGLFDHGAAAGDASNSTTTATFVGGFNANQVRFSGTTTAVNNATWGNEADIAITDPGATINFVWQTTGPAGTYGPGSFDFDNSQDFTAFAGGGSANPIGTWDLEFIDTFDDGAGADQQTTNLIMTFEEVDAIIDTDGTFALGNLAANTFATSNGEFGLASLFDLYTVTLDADGTLDIRTSADPGGFNGFDADTEIALFDAAGNLLFTNDDNPTPGDTFSELSGLALTAGDYTIAVASFNAAFADGFSVTPGLGLGDYALTVALVVPEPTTLGSSVWLAVASYCDVASKERLINNQSIN